ncbi:MAG: two-component system sensor histidine kinase NtrB [Myxococcaceae bacterium]
MSRGSASAGTQLLWVTVFRTVMTTLLLAALAARLLSRAPARQLTPRDSFAFVALGAVFLLSAVYGGWIRSGRQQRALAWVQLVADVLIAGGVVLLTGGIESPFVFLYSLAIVSGAILLPQYGAIAAAVGTVTIFGISVALIQTGHLPPELEISPLSARSVGFAALSNLLSQALIAVLATYLSRQLFAAGGRLTAQASDLKKLADLHRQILASMPSGLMTCTLDGRIQFINRAGIQILGVVDTERPAPGLTELLSRAKAYGPSEHRTELTVQTAAGERVLGMGVSTLVGDPRSLLIVFQDLTELRRIEASLRRADQLAALGKLSAQLAHEIRNPLAALRGSAQMVASEAIHGSTTERLATIVVREADRLEKLVQSFLLFARPPAPRRTPLRLDELTAETTAFLGRDPLATNVRLSSELSPVSIEADGDQLRQVLQNLIRNALEAAGPNGEVKVATALTGRGALVRIWDSAGKIGATEMPRLFEPFFTTRAGGTGLGLSTAQSIVNAHGGWIEVTSDPNKGTAFDIHLPLHAATSSSETAS